jgi:uncharacterized protein
MRSGGLGVGIVWWPELDPLCRESEGLVDVVEAEPEAFWAPNFGHRGFRSYLGAALSHLSQPKLLHGVGAPLCGTCPPPDGHASALVRDIAVIQPAFVSEHLNFARFRPASGAPPAFAGFMLPPLQSTSGAALAVANTRKFRATLGGIPLALETPVSYLPLFPRELPDGAFVATVAREADCGILLDLHNVTCNARNGRQPVADFCDAIPLERVWELHLAGGERTAGFHIDSHSGLVDPEVMEIAASLVPTLPDLQAIVFEIMPERVLHVDLASIARQLGSIRDLWKTRGAACGAGELRPDEVSAHPPLNPGEWEALLGCALTGSPLPTIHDSLSPWWQAATPALELYRLLAGEARASAVASAAPLTLRVLLREHGAPETRRILASFWKRTLPQYTAADEARAFAQFLSDSHSETAELTSAMHADTMAISNVIH